MKISSIRSIPIAVGDRNQLLVKVETDTGLHGWGESGLASRERAVAGAVEHYAKFLVGRDPMQIGAIWQEMYRSQYFEGGRVLTAAISAIDIALHDIKGKALGVPVYQLLGGRQRAFVPTFASVRAASSDEMIELARQVVDAGWNCIRLMVKSPDPHNAQRFEPWEGLVEFADWLTQARRALGPRIVLGIDWHHRLSIAEAASFCQRMPPGTLDFLEEPIRDETPQAYRTLRSLTNIPFAVGEEFASKWQFMPFIEDGLTQYARIDVCNVGGFTEAMKVAGWCEAHYIDMMPHNPLGPICTAATLHLAAAVPNFSWLECRESPGEQFDRYSSPIFINRPQLQASRYPVSDAPGLGVDIDESKLPGDVAFSFYEMPHFRRDDGSITNW